MRTSKEKIVKVGVNVNAIPEPGLKHLSDMKVFTAVRGLTAQFYGYSSLQDICGQLNEMQTTEKHKFGILPGLFSKPYKEYRKRIKNPVKGKKYNTSPDTADLYYRGPFLAFDYDAKDNPGNDHDLFFKLIKRVAVIAYRSASGAGVAGLFFVKGLSKLDKDTELNRYVHREHIAKAVYQRIEAEYFVKLDKSQGKMRQVRYLAKQKTPVEINKNFIIFTVPKFSPTIETLVYREKSNRADIKINPNIYENAVLRAKNSIEESIRLAGAGDHHSTICKVSILMGGLVGGGLVLYSEALSFLLYETRKRKRNKSYPLQNTIESGIKSGMRKPITKDSIKNNYLNYKSKNYERNREITGSY